VTPIGTQRSSKRTPATGNTKSSSSRYAAKGKGAGTNDVSSDNRGSSTRKRKLATMLEDGGPTTEKVESELLQTSQAKDSPLPNVPSPGEVLTMAADSNDGLEHLILSTQRTSKKRKKRRSIGQNSTKRVRTSLPTADATASSISHPNSLSANHQQQNGPPASGSEPDVSTQQSVAQHQGDSAVKAKRKKRKSIGKIPKVKRKSLIVASTSTQNVQATSTELASSLVQGRDVSSPVRRNPQKALASVEEVSENEFDEELSSARRPGNQEHSVEDDILSSAQTNRQGRPRTSHVSATAPVTKKAPKPQSARPKAPKRRTHPRTLSPISDTAERRPRKERPGAIPITVHRLSRPLPTDYSSADEDILAATNPFPTRGGVNAIDVLSQICREMVAKAAETLKLGEIRERGERKRVEIRKRKAVEMFGEELDARLFQMTEALDNNYALTIRLRQANKEKVAKREELLETKRLREEVAIEMDEVRAKHQRDTKVAQVLSPFPHMFIPPRFRPPVEEQYTNHPPRMNSSSIP